MNHLFTLSITFLGDLFHGRGNEEPEWPPSPHRVYQAMLCAAARNGCDGDEEFRWFESLDPPEILSPETTEARRYEFFVPNNDADVSKKFDKQLRLTGKVAHPTRIVGESRTVRYLWTIRPQDEKMAEKIIHHARLISAVGWGIDLAVADGQLCEVEDPMWSTAAKRWLPGTRGTMLRCPVSGTLDDLREVYDSFLHRINGKYYQMPRRPSRYREIGYHMVGDQTPRRPLVAFKLLQPEDDTDRWASFDPRRAMHVAAWVRGQACALTRTDANSFLEDYDSEQYVAGHVPSEAKNGPSPARFSYLPIPTIGHKHADGRIRRFIIAEPYGGDGRCANWAREALNLKTLVEKDDRDAVMCEPARLMVVKGDSVLDCYRKRSKVFETVTPVVLTGHDDRNYRKAEKMVLKAIEHAGFSCEDVESVYLQKAPFFAGAFHPREYLLPSHLRNHPHSMMHVRITWERLVRGPLAIGAGRYIGLGLFAAANDE